MSAAQILVVEDESLVAMAIKNELEQFGYRVSGIASSAKEAVEKAGVMKPDLVLMDIHLKGGGDGIEAAQKIHGGHGIPVVYLSAFSDPETVARASRTEAFGYLLKPYEVQELQTTIEMALGKHHAERRLEETERWLAAIHNGIGDAVITLDPQNQIRFINNGAENLIGWRKEEAVGLPIGKVASLIGADGELAVEHLAAKVAADSRVSALPSATWAISRQGRATPVEGSVSPIYDTHGVFLGTVLTFRDISSRLELERLRQQSEQKKQRAQKMEAVSRLAGGFAQHLNNLLTAILGNTSLALTTIPDATASRELLQRVELAAQHAAELVQRLSLFSTLSGRTTSDLPSVDLDPLIRNVVEQIQARLDSGITLTYEAGAELWRVQADELLLGQALLELAMNSQDAMTQGGQLTLEAENVTLAQSDRASHPDGQAGDFVRIRVSDTGRGMRPTVRARVFEPCFTTKESGESAGLGLAIVFAVVKQMHGWIDFTSHVHRGTQFDLYLPRYGSDSSEEIMVTGEQKPQGTLPLILLCEQDAMVREVGRQILEGEGYHVLLTADGMQAVAAYGQATQKIDLAILDLNMPRLSAYAVLERLLEIDSDVQVLFSGGYFSEDLIGSGGHTLGIITKPYRREELIDMVRRAIARRRGRAAST